MMQPQQHTQQHTRGALPAGAHGRPKVAHWVIATVPTEETAQTCARALEEAGFADDDVLVEQGAVALGQLRSDEDGRRHAGILARVLAEFEDALTGAEPVRDEFVAQAQAGRVFIGARDVQGNQADFIRNLFLEHGASSIYRFEPTEIRPLG